MEDFRKTLIFFALMLSLGTSILAIFVFYHLSVGYIITPDSNNLSEFILSVLISIVVVSALILHIGDMK